MQVSKKVFRFTSVFLSLSLCLSTAMADNPPTTTPVGGSSPPTDPVPPDPVPTDPVPPDGAPATGSNSTATIVGVVVGGALGAGGTIAGGIALGRHLDKIRKNTEFEPQGNSDTPPNLDEIQKNIERINAEFAPHSVDSPEVALFDDDDNKYYVGKPSEPNKVVAKRSDYPNHRDDGSPKTVRDQNTDKKSQGRRKLDESDKENEESIRKKAEATRNEAEADQGKFNEDKAGLDKARETAQNKAKTDQEAREQERQRQDLEPDRNSAPKENQQILDKAAAKQNEELRQQRIQEANNPYENKFTKPEGKTTAPAASETDVKPQLEKTTGKPVDTVKNEGIFPQEEPEYYSYTSEQLNGVAANSDQSTSLMARALKRAKEIFQRKAPSQDTQEWPAAQLSKEAQLAQEAKNTESSIKAGATNLVTDAEALAKEAAGDAW